MFAVEIYAAVRRFVFVEGKSRREAARVFGLSRDTIAKMCRYSAPPGYVRSKAPERPKLGPRVPVIDAILEAIRRRRRSNGILARQLTFKAHAQQSQNAGRSILRRGQLAYVARPINASSHQTNGYIGS